MWETLNIPSDFENFVRSSLIWTDQDNLASMWIPRNLVLWTLWIMQSLNDSVLLQTQFLLAKNIKWVLSILISNLLAINHWATILSSFLAAAKEYFKERSEYNTVVSSANKVNLRIVDIRVRSLTYNRTSNGPKMDPCGTPVVNLHMQDRILANSIYW